MKVIELKDNVGVRDKSPSVKGVVKLIDSKTGKIIFKKNNLVVNQGRKLMRELFYSLWSQNRNVTDSTTLKTDLISIDTSNKTVKLDRKLKIKFGKNSSSVSATDIEISEVDGLSEDMDPVITFISPEEDTSNSSDFGIKFTTSISGSTSTPFNLSEIGIVLVKVDEDGNESTDEGAEILFSRLVFDQIPITSTSAYSLEYTLYF